MADEPQKFRIAVIGGGITGLSAAHRLIECSEGIPMEVTLLEGGDRLGGGIRTIRRDGYLIEAGPDNFITTKPWGLNLCKRIGLADRLIQTNDSHRRAFLVHRDELHPLPDGFLMLAPTRIRSLVTSRLFSWRGKLRMAVEPLIPRKKDDEDESLASFVTRRLGREALQRAAQPLVSGIYTSDPETLSLRATMPRFLEMETECGSIIRGMRREQRRKKKAGNGGRSGESGARYSMFVTLDNGLQVLIDSLTSRLPPGVVRLNRRVAGITPIPNAEDAGAKPRWKISLQDGNGMEVHGIIIAVPAYRAAKFVEGFDPELGQQIGSIEYASSAVVNLAYRRDDVPHPLNGFGFIVPAIEKRDIIACTFSSVKYSGRAPEGGVLLRCFLGGAIQPHIYEWEDDEMIRAVRREMRDLLGIQESPRFSLVHRHPQAMPQYSVGHLRQVSGIQDQLRRHPGLILAGNAYHGVGIPDCIHSGEEAAENLVKALGSASNADRDS